MNNNHTHFHHTMQIFVKSFTGKTFVIDVEPSNTLRHVKELINNTQKNLPDSNQWGLLYECKHLKDDLTLTDYQIDRETTLHMTSYLRRENNKNNNLSIDNLSIFIPSVYENITKKDIINTFHRMNIGKVNYVDLVSQNRNDGKLIQNRAFVYFDTFYDTVESRTLQDKLNDNRSAKIHYGKSPHVFWVLIKNKGNKLSDPTIKPYRSLSFEYSDDNSEHDNFELESVIKPMTIEELDTSDTSLSDEFEFNNIDEDCSLVSTDYVKKLEEELYSARNQYAFLYANYQQYVETYN